MFLSAQTMPWVGIDVPKTKLDAPYWNPGAITEGPEKGKFLKEMAVLLPLAKQGTEQSLCDKYNASADQYNEYGLDFSNIDSWANTLNQDSLSNLMGLLETLNQILKQSMESAKSEQLMRETGFLRARAAMDIIENLQDKLDIPEQKKQAIKAHYQEKLGPLCKALRNEVEAEEVDAKKALSFVSQIKEELGKITGYVPQELESLLGQASPDWDKVAKFIDYLEKDCLDESFTKVTDQYNSIIIGESDKIETISKYLDKKLIGEGVKTLAINIAGRAQNSVKQSQAEYMEKHAREQEQELKAIENKKQAKRKKEAKAREVKAMQESKAKRTREAKNGSSK